MKKKIYTAGSILDCRKINRKKFPFSVMLDFESILPHQFEYNEYIENVLAGVNTKAIGERAFANCINLERVDGAIDIVGFEAFAFCTKMHSFNFSAVKSLSKGTFSFSGLQEVLLPDSIQNVPIECFYGCNKLKKLNLNNIEEIEEAAFASSGLEILNLPKKIKRIGKNAFNSCFYLTDIVCEGEKPPKINMSSFYGCNIKNIWFFNDKVMENYKNSPNWKKFASCFKMTDIYALSKRVEEISALSKEWLF